MGLYRVWRSRSSNPAGAYDAVTWEEHTSCFARAIIMIAGGFDRIQFLPTSSLNDEKNRIYQYNNGTYFFQVRKIF